MSFLIAEVGNAHDGSLGTAHAFIDAVASTGADAIKFQHHLADQESTLAEPWRVKFSYEDSTRYDYWKRMEFTNDQWRELLAHTKDKGLIFICSPFSEASVDVLDRIKVDGIKVPSGEVTNLPLLRRIRQSNIPVYLSSGMSTWEELDRAVHIFRNTDLVIMQCTSEYPVKATHIGLNIIEEMRARYHRPIGLSDHSGYIFPALAASALWAAVIEVHVTLSKHSFGPDVSASITIEELTQVVQGAKYVRSILESPVNKDKMAQSLNHTRKLFQKSLVASRDLNVGTTLGREMLVLKKPGNGIQDMSLLVGKSLSVTVKRDEILTEAHVG